MPSLLLASILAASAPAAAVTTPPSPSASASAALPSLERRQELLFEAAKLGRADLIPLLVRQGADVNAYEGRGFTPLILAAYNGQAAAVDALLKAGADPCKADRSQGNTALMGVAFKGDDRIAAMLLRQTCDVDARNNAGQTALMMAALFNRTQQVGMLLKAGADPQVIDAAGRSAASVVAAQGNTALAEQLAAPKR
ncbi:ankyrin repeat protein [Novosphingobium chloroacetimidivorans]|uniref:Ankyrin repeat protein n=1 Tax=Novosphingobium chloroacetimidivorans TaxID=1428314 RepID=A0A7W7NVX7_9SPHN|nr:ankyrin repeat domain-containing protein [Novosphingobium chloroacetimidivorans]MBB4857587.1 ankyrin repeat protein [Novosphingobium chloroacetimidivorans]